MLRKFIVFSRILSLRVVDFIQILVLFRMFSALYHLRVHVEELVFDRVQLVLSGFKGNAVG